MLERDREWEWNSYKGYGEKVRKKKYSYNSSKCERVMPVNFQRIKILQELLQWTEINLKFALMLIKFNWILFWSEIHFV